jgi:hypothetical protein
MVFRDMIKVKLEIDYIHFLCINLLENRKFLNEYSKIKYVADENFEFYYDKELINFIIKVLQLGESFDFLSYNKLNLVFNYVFNILYLFDRQESINNQNFYINLDKENQKTNILREISDYVFEDSVLLKFEVDYQENICKLFFSNVLIYGDKKKKPDDDVEIDNVMLLFTGLKNFIVNGTFNLEVIKSNGIYSCKYYKVNDVLYGVILLCISNYEHVILDITSSNIITQRF